MCVYIYIYLRVYICIPSIRGHFIDALLNSYWTLLNGYLNLLSVGLTQGNFNTSIAKFKNLICVKLKQCGTCMLCDHAESPQCNNLTFCKQTRM